MLIAALLVLGAAGLVALGAWLERARHLLDRGAAPSGNGRQPVDPRQARLRARARGTRS